MFEDGVKHRAGPLDEPLDMRCALAVDVRKEEKLLISLEHETREMHGAEVVLRLRELGHQRGQLFGERLGVGRSLDREVKDEMTLTHSVLLGVRCSLRTHEADEFAERLVEPPCESIFEHEPRSYIAQNG